MESKQSSTPSLFNFLKEGLLLPSRNRRLFAAVCALVVATTWVLILAHDLAFQPIADEIRLDITALNSTDTSSAEFAELLEEIKGKTRELLIVAVAYVLVGAVVGAAVRIIVLFAAVTTCSGEQHAVGALLGRVKSQIKGPVLTIAFVYALDIAYIVIFTAMAAIVALLLVKQYLVLFFLGTLLVLVAAVFLVYFSFLCSLSLVVSVAEPGCHGAAPFGRAWRLIKGRKRQVVLYVAVIGALAAALSPVHTMAKSYAHSNTAARLLLELVYAALMAVVHLFASCAMTALYFERRESQQMATAATGYVKIPTEEANV